MISRHVLQPGWSWKEHAQPSAGSSSCELYHRGVALSGRMGTRTDEGEELVIGPHQVFDLPPGHATWVEGDDVLVMVDWAGGAGFETWPGEEAGITRDIAEGAKGLTFESRGRHRLRGLERERELFAAASTAG